jgi:hypothetical protein
MDLKTYKDRSKVIKKIIMWGVIIFGLLAIFFLQTKSTGSFFITKNLALPVYAESSFTEQNLSNKIANNPQNTGSNTNTTTNPAQGKPINVCNEAIGVGCLTGVTEEKLGRGSSAIVNSIMQVVFFLIFLSGGVAVLFMVLAGYKMITSNGVEEQYASGLATLKYASIGLVLVIMSVTIVVLINAVVPNINLFG